MERRKPTKPRRSSPKLGTRGSGPDFSKRKRSKSVINKLSAFLLGTNKILRDMNAVNKGQIGDRLVRRATGKMASKGLGSDIFKIGK